MSSPSLLLEDYLDRADFSESLLALAGDLAKKVPLPARVDELGLVCQSVQTAAAYLEKKYKMKPFFLCDGSPSMFTENGKDVSFTTRLGFGVYKGVILELAEPGIGSNVFGQTIATENQIMINHLGFAARGMSLERKNGNTTVSYAEIMKNAGIPKTVEAVLDFFGFIGHVHIFETMNLTHSVEIEFLDFRLFGQNAVKISYPFGLVSLVGWIQEKTGYRFLKLKENQILPPEKS